MRRNDHRVAPGLYTLGEPTSKSPVFVSANYTLSFDALRSALAGIDGYILVLDTQGINVWCAAGKGTFGTEELVRRVEEAGLAKVVRRRSLILPQLGAPGVAGYEVEKRTGFAVEYGPVRAADLPEYLRQGGEATPEMRRVRFPLVDRIVLVPVELVAVLLPLLVVGLVMRSLPAVASILAGAVLFPILLPWLPTPNFSTKGWALGALVTLPFAVLSIARHPEIAWPVQALVVLSYFLIFPSVTAFIALNFTGSTPFASRSGVKAEMRRYAPAMAWTFAPGVVLNLILLAVR